MRYQFLNFAVWLLSACAMLTLGGCAQRPTEQAEPTPGITTIATAVPTEAEATSTPKTQQGEQSQPLAAGEHEVQLAFCNVGRADAMLLQIDGHTFAIDTGTKEAVPQLFGVLETMGVEKLDAVFLTHTHDDHIGGMEALSRAFPIERLYAAEISQNKKNGTNKITLLSENLEIPLTRLHAGETVPLTEGVAFTVLGPLAYNAEDDNDNSLVLRLEINGTTLLLTGDMQFAEEQTLLDAGALLQADVLKVGNHGNPDATGDDFAAAVMPKVAVISTNTTADANSANPRVLAALKDAETYITQDTRLGFVLTLGASGTMQMTQMPVQQPLSGLSIASVDPTSQTVVIQNDGAQQADLSGCILLSSRGGESFRFPQGAALAAGKTLTVVGEGGQGDYQFTGEGKPWHQKKADTALLYDRFGNELSRK